MKNFDSRSYSINDFLEWHSNEQLVLSPKFQRRSVWTDTARSYLMDTIVRGLPIPKIFIRQSINVQTRASIREVVDGQQRLRTILSFLNDGFVINPKHNPTYGGLYFSQLGIIDEEVQSSILNYELAVDLLVNMPDEKILDVFGRLNSYAVTLNEQEKINANHFGPFKTLADNIAHKFHKFWLESKILSEQNILRMGDVQLSADLLIAMIEGIRSKKQIAPYYKTYEKEFDCDVQVLEDQFTNVIETIKGIFEGNLKTTEFRRIHIFYTLFTAIYHMQFGLRDINIIRKPIIQSDFARISNKLALIDNIFQEEDKDTLSSNEKRFLEDSRRATTDTLIRKRRTEFVLNLIS